MPESRGWVGPRAPGCVAAAYSDGELLRTTSQAQRRHGTGLAGSGLRGRPRSAPLGYPPETALSPSGSRETCHGPWCAMVHAKVGKIANLNDNEGMKHLINEHRDGVMIRCDADAAANGAAAAATQTAPRLTRQPGPTHVRRSGKDILQLETKVILFYLSLFLLINGKFKTWTR